MKYILLAGLLIMVLSVRAAAQLTGGTSGVPVPNPTLTPTLAGDVTGPSSNNTLAAIHGVSVASAVASASPGQMLVVNTAGTWVPSATPSAGPSPVGSAPQFNALGIATPAPTAGVLAVYGPTATIPLSFGDVIGSAGFVGLSANGVSGSNYGMMLSTSNTYLNAPTGGQVIIRINNGLTAEFGSGTFIVAIPSTSSALAYACYNSGASAMSYDGTGVCSASREDFKDIEGPIDGPLALNEVMQLKPIWAKYKDSQTGTPDHAIQPMLGAFATEQVDKRLVSYGPDGLPRAPRYLEGMPSMLTAAMQEQQREIRALELGAKPRSTFWGRLRWLATGE